MVKKKIIEVLFALAVILLAANLLAAKYLKAPAKIKRNVQSITASGVNDVFIKDLRAFAIHSDWIKNIKSSHGQKPGFNYSVDIPQDLPIPVVLKEIYESFYDKNVDLKTAEEKIRGKTEFFISQDKKLKLKAIFNYNDNLKREGESIGLIIDGMDKLNKNDLNYLAKFPQTFAALLVPSKSSVQQSDTLIEYRKEYAVLLNDDINEMDYKLRGDFSPVRIKSALRTIIGSFPNALFYVIDNRSKLYNSTAYYLIKEQLQKRGILLMKMSSLKDVAGDNNAELKSDFTALVKTKTNEKPHFILIPADDFNLLQPQIFSFIKIGYKFVNPSIVLAAAIKSPNKKN